MNERPPNGLNLQSLELVFLKFVAVFVPVGMRLSNGIQESKDWRLDGMGALTCAKPQAGRFE